MRERRFTPLRQVRVQEPSRLANLDGSRRPGGQITVSTNIKAPKNQLPIGTRFHFDGEVWEIIYSYRLADEPGVWHHCIESRGATPPVVEVIGNALTALGAGATTPRVVYNPFRSWHDASQYFSDIYAYGHCRMHRSTQQLLKLKRA